MNSQSRISKKPSAAPCQKESSGQFRLTSAQRLKTPSEFQCVYSSKQWGGSKYFTFNVLANDIDAKNTLGVTVSKKVSKRAVDRNKLKRVMREFYRQRQAELSGTNLVLTAKPASKLASSDERLKSLEELWVKVLKWQRWHNRELMKSEEQLLNDDIGKHSLKKPFDKKVDKNNG